MIISGVTSGLGKALAAYFEHTYTVVGLSSQNGDVRDWEQVKDLNADILINNAAVNYSGLIEDVMPEAIKHTFDVNVVGVLNLTKAVTPYMKRQGGGHIFNINSTLGLIPAEKQALYGGSKWALRGITKMLQEELKSFNIQVTGIYPGALERGMKEQDSKRMDDGVPYIEIARTIEFILNRENNITITEIGIKNIYG